MPITNQTTLNRTWLIKMLIFLAVLLVFGAWGLYDATVAYPRRGANYAEFMLKSYLEQVKQAGYSLSRERVSVPDPVGEYARLAGRAGELTAAEAAKHEWLRALAVIGRLTPQHTEVPDPEARLAALTATWSNRNQPKRLQAFDIKVQWIFVIVGLGGGAWLAAHVVRVKSRVYRWDAGEKRLHLPDGSSLVPQDIAEFDKRKWDKFLIFLKIKEGHDRHAGEELRLDLLTHKGLEDWVLEMEKIAFPENAEPAAEPAPKEAPAA